MSAHDAGHEERLLAHALAGGASAVAERPAVVEQLVGCEACLTYAARLAEDTVALGGDPARVVALIDEALVWLAVRADGDTGGPATPAPAGEAPEAVDAATGRRSNH